MNLREKISNLYWTFKDIKNISNFNKDPNCYFIRLPQRTEKIFLDIYIKAGALLEPKAQAGIGHILEHYISNLVKKELKNSSGFFARIGDNYINFGLELERNKDILSPINKVLDIIINPDFKNKNIFEYEKKSIEDELKQEQSNVELKFERLIVKTRYLDESNTRSFIDHLDKINDLSLENIANYHKKIITKNNVKIFISSSARNKKLENLITQKIKKINSSDESITYPKPEYSNIQMRIEEIKDINGNYIAMTFPSLNWSASLKDSIVLAIIVDIMRDKENNMAHQKTRETGIYNLDITYNQGVCNGYIMIKSFLSKDKASKWLEIVCNLIKKMKYEEDLFLLEKVKDKWTKSNLKYWRSNNGRFNILIDFVLNQKEIVTFREIEKLVKTIKISDIKQMAQKIFDKEKMNLVIYGDIEKKMTQSYYQIDELL
jgi:predicted Zn-dependent peptidase